MQFRLALALSVSLLLIGVASWSRFTTLEKMPTDIVAVEQLELTDEDYDEILGDFTEPKTASTTSPEIPLTNTDLLGRQLIMDYLGFAADGEATENDIVNLANKYVEGLPTLSASTVINYSDIKTVPDTKSNFQKYTDALTKIHDEYGEKMSRAQNSVSNFSTMSPELYSLYLTMSNTYTNTASKLRGLPVPASLAYMHLALVNNFFSNAAATNAMYKADEDPATAFAGLITLGENVNKESTLLNQIGQILTSNGI